MNTDFHDVVIGRNAVMEALKAKISIDKVFIVKSERDAALRRITEAAYSAGIPVVETDKRKLDAMCADAGCEDRRVHQGVAATVASVRYATVEGILDSAKQKAQQPLIVICDDITDPHNLGAIIRTCEAAGVHGVIIPKRGSAGLGSAAVKASSGAVFHVKVARVPNISAVIRKLKDNGIWVYGAMPDGGTVMWDTDFTGAAALVIGSEGKGISRLVSENCDFWVRIPMDGRISSLNASVCASLLLYEVYRQRRT